MARVQTARARRSRFSLGGLFTPAPRHAESAPHEPVDHVHVNVGLAPSKPAAADAMTPIKPTKPAAAAPADGTSCGDCGDCGQVAATTAESADAAEPSGVAAADVEVHCPGDGRPGNGGPGDGAAATEASAAELREALRDATRRYSVAEAMVQRVELQRREQPAAGGSNLAYLRHVVVRYLALGDGEESAALFQALHPT